MTGPGCGWSKISRVRAPYDNLDPAVKPLQSPESAVYIMDSLLAGPDRPSGASGRHDSRNRSWRRPATTTLDESTSARMAMMTCSGREAQASQRRASLERNRSAVGKTANSLVYPRRQQLTPLPCGGPARLDPSLEPTRSAVLISGLATGPPAGVGGGLRFPLLACNRSILFPKRAPYPAIQSLLQQTPCPSR